MIPLSFLTKAIRNALETNKNLIETIEPLKNQKTKVVLANNGKRKILFLPKHLRQKNNHVFCHMEKNYLGLIKRSIKEITS